MKNIPVYKYKSYLGIFFNIYPFNINILSINI